MYHDNLARGYKYFRNYVVIVYEIIYVWESGCMKLLQIRGKIGIGESL